MKFQIECKTKTYAKKLLEKFEEGDWSDDDNKWIKLPECTHYTKVQSFKKICEIVEEIFDIIPNIEILK